MKLVEVTVSASRKFNIGNYESVDFFASIKAELDESDYKHLFLIANDMYEQCEKMINDQFAKSELK